MTGFEPQVSGVGSDRSANCATTTAPCVRCRCTVFGVACRCIKEKNKGRERDMMIRLTNQNDEAFSDIIF